MEVREIMVVEEAETEDYAPLVGEVAKACTVASMELGKVAERKVALVASSEKAAKAAPEYHT